MKSSVSGTVSRDVRPLFWSNNYLSPLNGFANFLFARRYLRKTYVDYADTAMITRTSAVNFGGLLINLKEQSSVKNDLGAFTVQNSNLLKIWSPTSKIACPSRVFVGWKISRHCPLNIEESYDREEYQPSKRSVKSRLQGTAVILPGVFLVVSWLV